MKIIVDPRCRISYASYYLKGLWDIYGRTNVVFDISYFSSFHLFENKTDYNKCMIFIVQNEQKKTNIVIDFDDSDSISDKHYKWADIYGKINVKKEELEKNVKIIAIGPSFGINIIGFWVLDVFFKLLISKFNPVSIKEYVKDYLFLIIRRRPYSEYLNSTASKDYIFSISTLWYDSLTHITTNKYRGIFFQLCKKIFKRVEGGFFYITSPEVIKEFPKYEQYKDTYKDIFYTKRISPREYLLKTKKSFLVFNTPSVMGCLGWKLAEYFAMGKPMISTPLGNVMPEEGLVMDCMIVVSDEKEIEEAIRLFKNNLQLYMQKSNSSKMYFHKHLSPLAVLKRLIQ